VESTLSPRNCDRNTTALGRSEWPNPSKKRRISWPGARSILAGRLHVLAPWPTTGNSPGEYARASLGGRSPASVCQRVRRTRLSRDPMVRRRPIAAASALARSTTCRTTQAAVRRIGPTRNTIRRDRRRDPVASTPVG
jgi:hypothetical protein